MRDKVQRAQCSCGVGAEHRARERTACGYVIARDCPRSEMRALQKLVHRPCVRSQRHSVLAEMTRRGIDVRASPYTLSQSRDPCPARVSERGRRVRITTVDTARAPVYNHQSMRAPPSPRPPPSTSHSDKGSTKDAVAHGRWRCRGASRLLRDVKHRQGPLGHFPDIIEFVPDTELMGRLPLRDMVPKMLSHVIGSFALMRRRHLHHLGQCRRPPPLLHGTHAGRLPGAPMVRPPSAQLLPFPLRPDLRRLARTPRARAGVRVEAARTPAPDRTQGAGRTRGCTARPPRRAEGEGRAARVELSSILGGLTARTRGTPAHLRQSFHLPSLHLGWKAAPRRLVLVLGAPLV